MVVLEKNTVIIGTYLVLCRRTVVLLYGHIWDTYSHVADKIVIFTTKTKANLFKIS